ASCCGYDTGISIHRRAVDRGSWEMKSFVAAGSLAFGVAVTFSAYGADTTRGKPLYQDATAPVDQRVEDLLSRMTPEEKLAQLTAVWSQKTELFDAQRNIDPAKLRKLYPHGIGHFTRPNDLVGPGSPLATPSRDATQTVALVNAIQRYQMKETRL